MALALRKLLNSVLPCVGTVCVWEREGGGLKLCWCNIWRLGVMLSFTKNDNGTHQLWMSRYISNRRTPSRQDASVWIEWPPPAGLESQTWSYSSAETLCFQCSFLPINMEKMLLHTPNTKSLESVCVQMSTVVFYTYQKRREVWWSPQEWPTARCPEQTILSKHPPGESAAKRNDFSVSLHPTIKLRFIAF